MTPEIKKKWDALKYRMERESYLLILLELRFASLEYAITMSFGHREVALALGLSDRYVRLMKQIRDTTEGTIEDYALAMLEYVYEENRGDKRNFTHFRVFDTDALERWWKNKRREEELDVRQICKESLIADFKHDYWRKFKTDVQITELETEEMKDPEEPQETKMDEELIDEEKFAESMVDTQKKEHQMEIVAKMVASGAIMPEVAFEYMNKDNDFHDYDNFLRILDIWTEKEERQHDDSDD